MKELENKIILGDCLEVMKSIPDKSIDCVITDPPYGIEFRSNFRKDKFDKIKNDEVVDLSIIKELYRVLKDGSALYLYTRWDVYPNWKTEIEKYFKVKNCIIWHKEGGGIGDLDGSYMYNHEFCIFAVKGRHKLNGKRISDVWKLKRDNVKDYLHPTQKPLSAMRVPIEKSSKENDLILDPFAGSGSTCVAAQNLHRRFIGIELEEKYCEIARDRLKQQTLL